MSRIFVLPDEESVAQFSEALGIPSVTTDGPTNNVWSAFSKGRIEEFAITRQLFYKFKEWNDFAYTLVVHLALSPESEWPPRDDAQEEESKSAEVLVAVDDTPHKSEVDHTHNPILIITGIDSTAERMSAVTGFALISPLTRHPRDTFAAIEAFNAGKIPVAVTGATQVRNWVKNPDAVLLDLSDTDYILRTLVSGQWK